MIGSSSTAPEATFGFAESDSPTATDVQVTAVSTHGWRLSDGRLPARDPMRLLAYVERRGEVFEVLQLGAGFELHEFASMEAAFRFVVETGPGLAQERMQARRW